MHSLKNLGTLRKMDNCIYSQRYHSHGPGKMLIFRTDSFSIDSTDIWHPVLFSPAKWYSFTWKTQEHMQRNSAAISWDNFMKYMHVCVQMIIIKQIIEMLDRCFRWTFTLGPWTVSQWSRERESDPYTETVFMNPFTHEHVHPLNLLPLTTEQYFFSSGMCLVGQKCWNMRWGW